MTSDLAEGLGEVAQERTLAGSTARLAARAGSPDRRATHTAPPPPRAGPARPGCRSATSCTAGRRPRGPLGRRGRRRAGTGPAACRRHPGVRRWRLRSPPSWGGRRGHHGAVGQVVAELQRDGPSGAPAARADRCRGSSRASPAMRARVASSSCSKVRRENTEAPPQRSTRLSRSPAVSSRDERSPSSGRLLARCRASPGRVRSRSARPSARRVAKAPSRGAPARPGAVPARVAPSRGGAARRARRERPR